MCNLTANADKTKDKTFQSWSKKGIFENVVLSFDLTILKDIGDLAGDRYTNSFDVSHLDELNLNEEE